ncbi:MAG: hypothetical protein M3680_07730 [Myxococcota bacterium]|nr:hypothetical protein [Myxococcota bacterium]
MRYLVILLITACSTPAPHAPDAGTSELDAASADADAALEPHVPRIPVPTGPCPPLVRGDVVFAPAGIAPRRVRIELAPPPVAPGPLLLYWHATGSITFEPRYALGDTLGAITGSGGVIAAPHSDPTAGLFEWFMVNQSPRLDDFLVADEIVACLVQAQRVDPRRIHSLGFSAGALQTTAMSFLRASYLASVVTYSGGVPPQYAPVIGEPANKLAALIFHGGLTDVTRGVDFASASATYQTLLAAAGHFVAMCDHGKGHAIPRDAAPSIAAFFAAHPFGTSPSPYTDGLPAGFPPYCTR